MNREPAHSISKRGRLGEGRPTKRTAEVIAKIAQAVAIGLTDEEASLLAGVNPDTMSEWRKDPEFSGAIKKATAQRLLLRLKRIEAGEQGWQGIAWALERLSVARFSESPAQANEDVLRRPGDQLPADQLPGFFLWLALRPKTPGIGVLSFGGVSYSGRPGGVLREVGVESPWET
jgi:hypothetical protein